MCSDAYILFFLILSELTCPNPPLPAYGSFYATSKDLTYESNITYTCNEGYTLEGPINTQCSLTGEWVYNDDVVEVPLCKSKLICPGL